MFLRWAALAPILATAILAARADDSPSPYRSEDVSVPSAGFARACTLTVPHGGGRHPAVLLETGSGPQNRDEEIFGFRPFLLLADHLTRNGVAVLRCDDRGVGGTSGSAESATTEDFALDSDAGVAFLTTQPDVDAGRIGILGHSEGGIVAAMVASRSPRVAFVVMLAGPGVTGERILLSQGEKIARAEGASDAEVAEQRELQQRTFRVVRAGTGWDEWKADLRRRTLASIEALPADRRAAISDVSAYADAAVNTEWARVRSPWFRFFLDYDPSRALRKIRCPVLAVFGEKDLQVPAEENAAAVRRALKKARNRRAEIAVVPNANHLFMEARSGSPSEYAGLRKAFAPGVLERISSWIREHAGPVASPAVAPLPPEDLVPPARTSAPSSGGSETRPEFARAESLLQKLVRGEFEEAVREFDATMGAALPPQRLREIWNGLIAQVGSFKSVDERRSRVLDGLLTVDLISTFEAVRLLVRVVESPDGKVSGLWFLPPERAIAPE